MKKKLLSLVLASTIVMSLIGCSSSSSDSADTSDSEEEVVEEAEETEETEEEEEAEAAEEAEEEAAEEVEEAEAEEEEEAEAEEEEEAFQMKVGICMSDHTNTSFIAMLDAAREYAEEDGNITIIEQDGKSDAETIYSAIENFINSECDAIIYQNSFPEVTDSIIKEAAEAGICVIAYETENEDATYSWISDNEMVGSAIGTMAGEWINEYCDGKGVVSVICNDSIEFLKARGDAMVAALLEVAPDSEVVSRQAARDITAGYTLAETLMISNPEINVYIATGDAAAVGVSQAYEAAGWTDPLGTFGADCTDEAVAAMKDEDTFVAGSIDLQLPTQMVNMVKYAYDYCAYGTLQEDNVIVMDCVAVTRDTVNEYYPDD